MMHIMFIKKGESVTIKNTVIQNLYNILPSEAHKPLDSLPTPVPPQHTYKRA